MTLPGDSDQSFDDGDATIASGPNAPALLMCVQLIAMEEMIPDLIPQPVIVPPTRDAFVEVVVFGLRNLAPYNLLPMSNTQVRVGGRGVAFVVPAIVIVSSTPTAHRG